MPQDPADDDLPLLEDTDEAGWKQAASVIRQLDKAIKAGEAKFHKVLREKLFPQRRELGRHLWRVKSSLGHGEWTPWLRERGHDA